MVAKRIYGLVFVGCMGILSAYASVIYATSRLQAMAQQLSLSGLDSLGTGEYDQYSFKSLPIIIRINSWNEVEHIGFKLFSQKMKEESLSVVYDFLERYLLELEMIKDQDSAIRLGLDKVRFDIGTSSTVYSLKETDTFRQSYVDFLSYRVAWIREGEEILSITFAMDFQLLSGCNSIELENKLVKELSRFTWNSEFQPECAIDVSDADRHTQKKGYFMIEAIRNDLYYEKDGEFWKLVYDESKPYQTIANMMLTTAAEGDFGLNVIMDRYGYKEDQISITLKHWLRFCEEEGCHAFWGMKTKEDSVYTGTMFMVNDTKSYVHMMSMRIPMVALKEKGGFIEGRLYAYIPLHNLSKTFFNYYGYKKE